VKREECYLVCLRPEFEGAYPALAARVFTYVHVGISWDESVCVNVKQRKEAAVGACAWGNATAANERRGFFFQRASNVVPTGGYNFL
jgi:hypothetical protein